MFEYSEIPTEQAASRIADIESGFPALAQWLNHLVDKGVWQDKGSDALLIKHRPDVAKFAFEATLFPPMRAGDIERLLEHAEIRVPPSLMSLYRRFNGGFFGGVSIYGLLSELSRTHRNPLDLAMSGIWRSGYAPCDEALVLFASQNVSWKGQVGYFVATDGSVIGRGNEEHGAPAEAGRWPSLDYWFADTLPE